MSKNTRIMSHLTVVLTLIGVLVGAACASASAERAPRTSPAVAPPPLSDDPNELLWQCREEQRWGIVLDTLYWSNYKAYKNRWTKDLQDELLWIKTRWEYVEIFYLQNIDQSRADGSLVQKVKQARDELTQIRERRIKFTQRVLREVFGTTPGVGVLEPFDLPAPAPEEAK